MNTNQAQTQTQPLSNGAGYQIDKLGCSDPNCPDCTKARALLKQKMKAIDREAAFLAATQAVIETMKDFDRQRASKASKLAELQEELLGMAPKMSAAASPVEIPKDPAMLAEMLGIDMETAQILIAGDEDNAAVKPYSDVELKSVLDSVDDASIPEILKKAREGLTHLNWAIIETQRAAYEAYRVSISAMLVGYPDVWRWVGRTIPEDMDDTQLVAFIGYPNYAMSMGPLGGQAVVKQVFQNQGQGPEVYKMDFSGNTKISRATQYFHNEINYRNFMKMLIKLVHRRIPGVTKQILNVASSRR